MIDNIITNTLLPALSREFLTRSLAKEELKEARVTIENGGFAYGWGGGGGARQKHAAGRGRCTGALGRGRRQPGTCHRLNIARWRVRVPRTWARRDAALRPMSASPRASSSASSRASTTKALHWRRST